MLPAGHRLTSSAEFRLVSRRGLRQGRRRLVVHLLAAEAAPASGPVLVGLTVSKAVGGAVVRTRVKRRLRHLCAARLDRLPPGSRLVVRALPPAADSSSAALARDLDSALGALLTEPAVSGGAR